MAATIYSHTKTFNGKRYGFQFKDGQARIEDVELAKSMAKDFGYEIELDEPKQKQKPKPKAEPKKESKAKADKESDSK